MVEPPRPAPASTTSAEPDRGNSISAVFDPDTQIGRDLDAVDWAATSLGPVSDWPPSLHNIVRLLLGSRFAMWMAWGPELTFLCNDAYRRDTLGAKYPWALGRPAAQVWSEIWPDISPRIESVMTTGVATWDEQLMLFLERSGYQEETYHTFSYSPLTDDDGQVSGMLCVVSEETARVIGGERMAVLRDLGTALATAATEAEVHAAAARQLRGDRRILPFVVAYLFDQQQSLATLGWTAGIAAGHPAAPETISLNDPRPTWPVATVATGAAELVDDLATRFEGLPTGAWDEPPSSALLVPLGRPGGREPYGFLVVALNRYRPLDDDFRGFIDLLAGQLSAAITRGRAYEQERRRAHELAELDQAKTTFFTNVSHELRTPLTLLLGPVDDALADRDSPLPEPQRARIEMVERNGRRLLKLVNTLLDFSRMESGEAAAHFEQLDLARYTTELAAMFQSAAERAGLAFTVNCVPLPQRVYADREMWAKIVLNLLSNAFKATFTGGVTVEFGERDGAAQLSVTDTGIGIPAAEQARLFERFHRVSGAALRSHEGSGIGLALVAELAAVHGATIDVTSAPGTGSTFTVRVPYGTAHLPIDQVVPDPVDEIPDVERYSAGYLAEASRWFDETAAERPRLLPASAGAAHHPVVLVVDDNPDMRDYVSGLLADSYRVETAADGVEALESSRSILPDLVLTDVMMPRLDGFGLLSALRDDPATMHIPVIMLSARSSDEATVAGLEAGADDYLVKPFSARELLARVRSNLELDRVRRVADELARSRQLLDQAEKLAHVGSWEIDLNTGGLIASHEYFRILGVPEDAFRAGGLELAMRSVHEDDRAALEAALDATGRDGSPMTIEARVQQPDGGERLVRAHGELHRDDSGAPAFIRGSVQDITDQRRAEIAQATAAATREAAAREHAIAEELQRSLLPALTFRADRIDVAAYYRAGVEGTQAGGDWYDVIDLEDGRTGLVLGDVMGRGVAAAAVMGQLRATVRAYARLELPPGELLTLLDDTVATIGSHTIVTCVYAVFDASARTLTYANAGHLPPLLTPPGGPTRALVAGDPPLGTGHYAGRVETITVAPETRITLYTDGLVEHRERDLDTGIAQLIATLDHVDVPVEGVPSVLVQSLLPHEPDDDVAILSAVLGREEGPRQVVSVTLDSLPHMVAQARETVDRACVEWGVEDATAFDVKVIVSELVTNAIRHGRPPVQLLVRHEPGRVLIDVSDASGVKPDVRHALPSAANGRGLALIAALAGQWGTRLTGRGKSVWCSVPTQTAPAGS